MINRRKFLQNSGALALGGLALSGQASAISLFGAAAPKNPGVQLYTVMSSIDKDLDGTLKKIAEIGYKEIESAFSMKGGFYGLTGKEFNAKIKSFGMSWQSHHTVGAPFKIPAGTKGADGKPLVIPPMKNLLENGEEIVNDAAQAGVPYLVCSSTPVKTSEELKQSIETLQKTGEACKKAGITFAYHNHWAEFEKVDGELPYDMILSQISADVMKLELDLAWATKGGVDPVELFKKHPGRFHLWHVKDIDKDQKPVEIGAGTIDFNRIFAAANTAGMKHFFVEQDQAPDPLVNLENSFKGLSKIKA